MSTDRTLTEALQARKAQVEAEIKAEEYVKQNEQNFLEIDRRACEVWVVTYLEKKYDLDYCQSLNKEPNIEDQEKKRENCNNSSQV